MPISFLKTKLEAEKVDHEDERNIMISRAAGLAGYYVGVGLLAALSFLFAGLGYQTPSYICMGGIYILVGVYVIAQRIYQKRM